MKISHRLWFISGLSFLLFILAIGIGWWGMKFSRDSLARVFEERAIPMQNLAYMQKAILNNCADILRGYQHDPAGSQLALHKDHDVSDHTSRIKKRLTLIDKMLSAYLASPGMSGEEKGLAVDLEKAYRTWNGIFNEAYTDLKAETYNHEVLAKFLQANDNELDIINEIFDGLIGLQGRVAKEEYEKAEAIFDRNQIIFAGLLLIGGFGVFGTVVMTIRYITKSIGEAGKVAEAIANGDLGISIEAGGQDELGQLMNKLGRMQNNLIVLVDDISKIVRAAEQGDLSKRVEVEDKQGFGRDIGNALNQLMKITDTSLQDIGRISGALAAGDLSQSVETVYPGAFGQTAEAVNTTVAALNQVMNEVRNVVNASSQGDFSYLIDAGNKQGYAKTLAEMLNSLCLTANEALTDISHVARALSEGDLTRKVEKIYPGLFGETAEGINITADNLRDLISHVAATVNDITSEAEKISSGNRGLSLQAKEQAASLEVTVANIERITTMAQQNAQSANQANDLAKDASNITINGSNVVNALIETMSQIDGSSKKIAAIINVIDVIAFQTNILALNAAVEAARAMEHGRGFAVVASEVRLLAQRSAKAAKEISLLISDSTRKVEQGAQQTQETGAAMKSILKSIASVASIAGNISKASLEQSAGIVQVNQAVSDIDKATQHNTVLVNDAADAANSLALQTQQLQLQMSHFKVA
ncbi:MAG: methyl-accepting chemotaxis protein [Methylomonas sp.]|jgi:methyl-accepting chemotaxis protein